MNFYKLYGMAFLLGLSMIPAAYAGPDDPAKPVPDPMLGAPQPRSEFYVKVNSGAVFFRPPEKDNSNFAEAVNLPAPAGKADGVTSVGSQTGNATAASIGATLGFLLAAQPAESWMGLNLRAEVSGNYFQTVNTQNAGVSVNPGGIFTTVGRLDGNYTGTNQSTDIGSLTAGPNPVANETLTTRDEFYQVSAAFKTDYIFDHGQLVLSPILGFGYSHLTQNFNTTAAGNRGSINQQETIDTNYFGPKFGLECKVQLAKDFVYYAEGEMSPLYAFSDYSGTQNGSSTRFGGGSGPNSATDSQNSFAFKAGLTTGFYYDFGPVILKVGGGFEYWNYVATVQESTIPSGVNTLGGAPAPFTLRPSHLASSDMLNPEVNTSVIVPF